MDAEDLSTTGESSSGPETESIHEDRLPWSVRTKNLEYLRDFEPSEQSTAREVEAIVGLSGIEPGAEVLDLCCGGGRHLVAMARLGMKVVGVDIGPGFAEIARSRLAEAGLTGEVIEHDVLTLAMARRFDLVTIMCNTFGFFDDDHNFLLLSKAHDLLRPGGALFLDVGNREHTLMHLIPRQSWFEQHGSTFLEHSSFDDQRSRWNSITIERRAGRPDRRWVHSKRLYTRMELERLLLAAGLDAPRLCGSFDLEPYGLASPKLIALARKPPGRPAWPGRIGAVGPDDQGKGSAEWSLDLLPAREQRAAEPGHKGRQRLLPVARIVRFDGLPSQGYQVCTAQSPEGGFRLSLDYSRSCIIISDLVLEPGGSGRLVGEALGHACAALADDQSRAADGSGRIDRAVLEVAAAQPELVRIAEAAGLERTGLHLLDMDRPGLPGPTGSWLREQARCISFSGAEGSDRVDDRQWLEIEGETSAVVLLMRRLL